MEDEMITHYRIGCPTCGEGKQRIKNRRDKATNARIDRAIAQHEQSYEHRRRTTVYLIRDETKEATR